jgi:hypothetical protein
MTREHERLGCPTSVVRTGPFSLAQPGSRAAVKSAWIRRSTLATVADAV